MRIATPHAPPAGAAAAIGTGLLLPAASSAGAALDAHTMLGVAGPLAVLPSSCFVRPRGPARPPDGRKGPAVPARDLEQRVRPRADPLRETVTAEESGSSREGAAAAPARREGPARVADRTARRGPARGHRGPRGVQRGAWPRGRRRGPAGGRPPALRGHPENRGDRPLGRRRARGRSGRGRLGAFRLEPESEPRPRPRDDHGATDPHVATFPPPPALSRRACLPPAGARLRAAGGQSAPEVAPDRGGASGWSACWRTAAPWRCSRVHQARPGDPPRQRSRLQ